MSISWTGGFELPTVEFFGRHGKYSSAASLVLQPRPVWPEIGDDPFALVQWCITIVVRDAGDLAPMFRGTGYHECDVQTLRRFADDLEELRGTADMKVSFGKLNDAFDLTLQMIDRRFGTVLVTASVCYPKSGWDEPAEVYEICNESTFPATLKVAFLTDQSAIAIARSQILSLIRELASLKRSTG